MGREQNWIFLLLFAGEIYPRLARSFDNTSCRSSFLLSTGGFVPPVLLRPHVVSWQHWCSNLSGMAWATDSCGKWGGCEKMLAAPCCAVHPLGSLWLLPALCLHTGTGAQMSSQWRNSSHCNGGSVGLFSCAICWIHFYFHCDSFYMEKSTLLLAKPFYYSIALQKKSRNTIIVCKCLYVWWMYC